MGAIALPSKKRVVKPQPWDVRPSCVAPEWRWVYDTASMVVPMWEGAGTRLQDIATRKHIGSLGSEVSWGVGRDGRRLEWSGNDSAGAEIATRDFNLSGNDSHTFIAYLTAGPTDAYRTVFGSDSDFVLFARQTAGDFEHRISGFDSNDRVSGPNITAGNRYLVAFKYDGAMNELSLFTDRTKNAVAPTGTYNDIGLIDIGRLASDRQSWAGTMYWAGIWSHHAVPDTRIRQLARDPLGPFRPQQQIIVRVPSGGAQTVSVSGSITPGGSVSTQVKKSKGGSSSPMGSLSRQAQMVLEGTSGISGEVTKSPSTSFTGSSTALGTLSLREFVSLVVSGQVIPSGVINLLAAKAEAGQLTATGEVLRKVVTTLQGSSTTSGSLTLTQIFTLAVSGSLTAAGTLRRKVGKVLDGSVSPTGVLSRAIAFLVEGVLTITGEVSFPDEFNPFWVDESDPTGSWNEESDPTGSWNEESDPGSDPWTDEGDP